MNSQRSVRRRPPSSRGGIVLLAIGLLGTLASGGATSARAADVVSATDADARTPLDFSLGAAVPLTTGGTAAEFADLSLLPGLPDLGPAAPGSEATPPQKVCTAPGYPCNFANYPDNKIVIKGEPIQDVFAVTGFVSDGGLWISAGGDPLELPGEWVMNAIWEYKVAAPNSNVQDSLVTCNYSKSVDWSLTSTLSVGMSVASTASAAPLGMGGELTLEASVEFSLGLTKGQSTTYGSAQTLSVPPGQSLACWGGLMETYWVWNNPRYADVDHWVDWIMQQRGESGFGYRYMYARPPSGIGYALAHTRSIAYHYSIPAVPLTTTSLWTDPTKNEDM